MLNQFCDLKPCFDGLMRVTVVSNFLGAFCLSDFRELVAKLLQSSFRQYVPELTIVEHMLDDP